MLSATMPRYHDSLSTAGRQPSPCATAGSRCPTQPVIPFIEGDGTGPDIWRASQHVFDAAVQRAYGGKRRIVWLEVLAGEKAKDQLNSWLPDDTLAAIDHHLVAIKGPLTTPVGGGFRSLNVALRQKLDLYACVRPVRWFEGVPSPVKAPQDVDMVIFRENTEDIYAGIEYKAGTDEARRMVDFLQRADGRPDHPLPGHQRHRHQADLRGGLQAAHPRGHRLRRRPEAAQRDAGAQGQHHEVHRGRLPRLGLRAGPGGVRRRPRSTAGPGAGCRRAW